MSSLVVDYFKLYRANMPDRSVDSKWSVLVCFCATLSLTLVKGSNVSFGVLLPAIMDEYKSSRQAASWVNSICTSAVFLVSPLAGSLCDHFGCRITSIIGCVLSAGALVLTSFVPELPYCYLTYGLMYGAGCGLVFTSSFLVTAQYFDKKRALANGLVSAAPGLGSFIFAPVEQLLLDTVGLANTFRALAAPCLATSAAAVSFYALEEDHNAPGESNAETHRTSSACGRCKVVDCSLWKIPAFTVCVVTFSCQALCVSSFDTHLVKHGQEIGFPPDRAANLLMFLGLASFVSRIAAGYLIDVKRQVDPMHVNQLASFLVGVFMAIFGGSWSYSVSVVLIVLYGLCHGALVSSLTLILLTVVDSKRRAAAFGLANGVFAFWFVSGPPLVGWMADMLGSYQEAFLSCGGVAILSSCLPFLLRCFPHVENEEYVLAEGNEQFESTV